MKPIMGIAAATLVAALAAGAQADVSDTCDVVINGVTYRAFQDDVSGLTWLDLDNFWGTTTYDAVEAAIAGSGWHIATESDLVALQSSIGLPAAGAAFDAVAIIMGGNWVGSTGNRLGYRDILWGAYDDGDLVDATQAGYSHFPHPSTGWTVDDDRLVKATRTFHSMNTLYGDMGVWVVSDAAINPDPVSSYPLDVDALDAIGSNDPSATNGLTYVPAAVGNGARFTTGSFIDVPHSASLANQELTIEAWVRPDGPGPNNDAYGSIIVQKGFSAPRGNTEATVSLYWSAQSERFRFLYGSINNANESILSTNTFPAGCFHHVAGTYDGATFKLYVDGVLEGQQALVKTIDYEAGVPWTIGASRAATRSGGYPRTFIGVIDDVNIWSCALSQSEIQSHAAVGDSNPNLVVNGSFESQTFTACFDDSQGIYCYSGVSLASGFFAPWTNGTSLFYALRSRPPYWVAQEGNQYVEVDSYAQVYQQTLATVPGQTYTLSFWYAPSAANNDDALRVLWDGAQVDVVDDAPTEASLLDWRKQSYTVTASGTSTVLRFEDAVNTAIYVGGFLDNVSVRFCTGSPSDSTPPTVTITAPADGHVTNALSVSVDADVVDDSETTVTSTPAGIAPGTLPAGGGAVSGSLPLALEGANTITVSADDGVNLSAATSIDVYRDTAPPVITILPAEGTIVSSPVPSFGITVDDQTLTSVSVDGDYAGSATVPGGDVYGVASALLTGSIPLWTEGANSIVVQATDAGGNVTTVTRTVILDSTAPVVAITTPANGACYAAAATTTIPLTATVDDATATEVTGALSESLAAGGGTVVGTYTLAEGVNTISVTATNPGLGLSASDTVSVTLDTILPTVVITSVTEGECVSGSVEFHATATDVLPGTVASTTYYVDGVALAATTLYTVDTTLLDDGAHVLRVDAFDSCGNVGTTSVNIVVDNVAPVVSITNPVDLAWVAGTIGFDADASDDGTGLASITMKAAGVAPTTDGSQTYATPVANGTASSMVDTILASGGVDGDMELEVTARDCAGNETTVAITVRVDNTDPVKAIISPADGSEVRCLLDIEGTVDDDNLASVQISVDGVLSPPLTAPYLVSFDTRDRLDGDMAISLIATDLAGNVSTCTINVTVDNLEIKAKPRSLQLKSKGGNKSVTAKISGQSAELLLELDPAEVVLCIPGGSPVPANELRGHIYDSHGNHGWRCEDHHESSHRGHRKGHEHHRHGHESSVHAKFDRQLLIGSLRGAGFTSGKVEVTIKATVDGVTFVLGTDTIRVKSGGGN